MRVAIVTTSYPRDEGDPSGHFVATHARDLTRAGHRVTVLAMGAARAIASDPDRGIAVEWLGGEAVFGWPGASEKLRRAPWRAAAAALPVARAIARARRADRIVAHWIVPSAFPIAVLAGASDVEVWAHGADVRLLAKAPAFARTVIGTLLRRKVRFVFVARALRDELASVLDAATARTLLEQSRCEAAPLHVPSRATIGDPRAPSERDGRYVVWVGRAVREKGPTVAASAARRVGVHLTMIGDGPELPEGDELVDVRGRLPRSEALAWIANASALVSTSHVEGAPTVVREARALGVPVVAFPAGDLAELAQRDDGIHLVHDQSALERWLVEHVAER